jgi:hypothetical protein
VKPDITFFGEKLSDEFDRCLADDRFRVDLLLVIGTSLKVSPVAEILCGCFSLFVGHIDSTFELSFPLFFVTSSFAAFDTPGEGFCLIQIMGDA